MNRNRRFCKSCLLCIAIAITMHSLLFGQAVTLPEMKSFVLDNGLKVIVVENHEQPAVLYSLMIKSGTLEDREGKEGATELVGKLLERGSKNFTADRLAERIDFLGARFDVEVSREYVGIELMVLSKDRLEGLDILADVVMHPGFPEAELALARKELLAEVKSVMDEPQTIAGDHLRSIIFGVDPRGRTKTQGSVSSTKREHVVEMYDWHFTPDNAVLVVIGDIHRDSTVRHLNGRFREWRRKGRIERLVSIVHGDPLTPSLPQPRIRLVDKPGLTQAFIALGFPSIKRNDPDYFAYLAMNHVLGGAGFSSRLMSVVRAQQGKTYGISSRFEAGTLAGPFMVRTFTQSGQTREMIQLIVKVMTEMKEKGITEQELDHVKTSQIGGYQLRFQTPSDLAREILSAELYGLGLDYLKTYPEKINALTVEKVNRAAATFLHPEAFWLVVVGDGATVDTIVAPLGNIQGVPYQDLYTK